MRKLNRAFFANPFSDPDYSVAPFWFWNDEISDARSAEQLGIMRRVGADQPIVHARTGLITEYLSEDWFARLGAAIDTARKNGQRLWLYDEKNWPSGNCAWTITKEEKFREHFLTFDNNDQETRARINVDPYEPVGKMCVDYLSREVIAAFIDRTHEQFRKRFGASFGETVSGTFMDETRFCNAYPWTDALPAEFLKRKGYDIMPLLPQLYGNGEKTAMIRYDYYDVISDLYAEATYQQIYDWCEKNKLRTMGHVLGEETIAAQCYFGGDVLRVMKYLHIPGIDHLGNGTGSLDAKFVSGAAHHYGKDRVACESFGGAGWDMNYEDMVHISNWLFQQGINLIIVHGFYYSIRDERAIDWPPSYFFQWKYWDRMQEYVPMANRMMEMLSGGRVEADVLLYSPMETFQVFFEPDLNLKTFFPKPGTVDPAIASNLSAPPLINDERARAIDRQFQLLCSGLEEENIGFEIINADAMGEKIFCAKNGRIINTVTGASYSVFILPCAKVITTDMAELLSAFAFQGGVVINYQSAADMMVAKNGDHARGELPKIDISKFRAAETIRDAVALCQSLIDQKFTVTEGIYRVSRSFSSYPPYIFDPYMHNGERVYGIAISRYVKDDSRVFHITNYNRDDEEIVIEFASAGSPELFNPETGSVTQITDGRQTAAGYAARLVIPSNRSLFVVFPL